MKKVVIIGPAHPLRGGLATFNQRLANQFTIEGYNTCIYSFSLQYPSFLFPGKSQYTMEPAPDRLKIFSRINSINPLNWITVGNELKALSPDVIVVRFWLPFMGPALGTILRRVRKNRHTKIVAITDNIIPHEKRAGDVPFTKYFLKSCDAFVAMSEKVLNDVKKFEPLKPSRLVPHPLYDNFGAPVTKEEARRTLNISHTAKIILFFGFIRKYKGLDLLFEAMKILKTNNDISDLKLLVSGEYYDDEKEYDRLVEKLNIADVLIMRTGFIEDNQVKYYFCATDVVVQPYRKATQSGVTPLAYHFDKPMIVTNVGGLAAMVPDGKAGLVCEPDPLSIAAAISRYFQLGENYFIPHLRLEKLKYSWQNLVRTIKELYEEINRNSKTETQGNR